MSIHDVIGEPVQIERDEQGDEQAQPQAPETTEQQPAPETPAPDDQHQASGTRTVPLPALHEERQRRRQLQAELQAERQARTEMEARVQARLDALQQSVAPRQQVPSLEENPVAHLKYSIDQVRDVATQNQQSFAQWQAQQQQVQQVQAIASRVTAAESDFVARRPDYHDALGYYRSQRAKEIAVVSGVDEDVAMQQVARELVEGALHHAAAGRNPAEIAYRLAETRGYKPKAQQATVSPAEKIETQQRGVAAARTVTSGGGTSGGLSAKALLEMSDEDFSKATKGNKWRELMGG